MPGLSRAGRASARVGPCVTYLTVQLSVFPGSPGFVTMDAMADTAVTAETFQSDLVDLSDVPLADLADVDLLPTALVGLLGGLATSAMPLCESGMAAMCGTAPLAPPGASRDS